MSAPKPKEHPTKIECVDCAKLPTYTEALVAAEHASLTISTEFRPRVLRKIDPRSLETHKTQPRCTTHWLAWRNAQRAKGVAAAGTSMPDSAT